MLVKRFPLDTVPNDQALFDQFERETGIDLGSGVILDKDASIKKFILIDEAQKAYGRENFWTRLIKAFPTWNGNRSYKFVFAVTYSLSIQGSPVEFKEPSIARIDTEDLLFTEAENEDYWTKLLTSATSEKVRAWLNYDQLRKSVLLDCGGQAGVIMTAFLFLEYHSKKPKHPLSEEHLLQLIFGSEYVTNLRRCFDVPVDLRGSLSGSVRDLLTRVYTAGQDSMSFATPENPDKLCLRSLIRSGVLKGVESLTGDYISVGFATPSGKRFFYEYLFPGRAPPGTRVPNVGELVLSAFREMSAKMLHDAKLSSGAREQFPKEAAFQQFLFMGLAKYLPIGAAVCPEMSQIWGQGKSKEPNSCVCR